MPGCRQASRTGSPSDGSDPDGIRDSGLEDRWFPPSDPQKVRNSEDAPGTLGCSDRQETRRPGECCLTKRNPPDLMIFCSTMDNGSRMDQGLGDPGLVASAFGTTEGQEFRRRARDLGALRSAGDKETRRMLFNKTRSSLSHGLLFHDRQQITVWIEGLWGFGTSWLPPRINRRSEVQKPAPGACGVRTGRRSRDQENVV